MEDNRKATKAQVFVRVRPFTEAESNVCPEDSPVPREIITLTGRNTLTVLDAANGFVPRKNGQFEVENVLWSFRDEENPRTVVHTQKDVYAAVVSPMIMHIVEGYSAAFCVAGAAGSGRVYSFYGDDVDSLNRGILPRFAEDIFNAFKKDKRENSSIACELEAVEVTAQETYVDLLAQRKRGAPPPTDELKLVNDPHEGPKLQGLTRVEVKKPSDVMSALRQLSRVAAKRSHCQTVHFRFVETYDFEDPEQPGQTVSKSRRINVLFVLLRSMPSAFQRCIEVAVERDSGENPLAKVPVRETAFTKLYPELLQQGYNLAFLCCVSPFYEHARETVQTLTFSTKVSKIKCRPKLLHDEALLELRNLSDEVKHLKTEVIRQTESMDVVQKEINAREVTLMKQEASHHECTLKLRKSEKDVEVAKHAVNINLYRTKTQRTLQDKQAHEKKKSMAVTKTEKESTEKEAGELKKNGDAANGPLRELQRQVEEQEKRNVVLEEVVNKHKKREKDVKKMEWFAQASPEERRRDIIESYPENEVVKKEMEKLESERVAHAAANEKELNRQRASEKEYNAVYDAEKGTREKEELQKEIGQLEKEIAETEAEIRQLQFEVDKRPQGCACILM